MSQSRLNRLCSNIEQQGLAAIALNAGPSLNYLTGLQFHLMERPVVMVIVPGHDPVIILPELEKLKLSQLQFPVQSFTYGENPDLWQKTFTDALQGLGLKGSRIGAEPRQLRLLEYTYLRGAVEAEYIDGTTAISSLRARKDAEEIASMRQAVVIAENALKATLPMIKIGVSEMDIASELFLQLIRNGSEISIPFSPIVAAGPNGANPHAKPSDRAIAEGDLLIIDWGARFNGYASDLTRTFAIGKIDEEAEKIHKIVQAANRAGREATQPGVACASVDRATRDVIEAAGYGEFFTHRTGHGIGMECHEDPYIHATNEQLLEEGNCCTVEPGIYLEGRNGVRIEDDVVVTADGAESLSTMSREIVVLG
ncbi:M24 family metallopeptidase [Desulfosediminicola flagellatus]|uniref:M24 family metallopeptidase n=1 Tax=Desulfosediminicola flagellatus TaxID=2569541 RepID=UPI0010AD3DBD|nr:Xaa-Pro peptidase family protein [Desulfosediminicola flagellatus]